MRKAIRACGKQLEEMVTKNLEHTKFEPHDSLTKIGGGRTNETYRARERIFSQGDVADSVFFIHKGKVKVTVISEHSKEAVVAVLDKVNFSEKDALPPRNFA